jgi:diguanylate cyclase (GGDEF)-like protein
VALSMLLALLGGLTGAESLVTLFFALCAVLLLRALVHTIRAARGGDRESRAIAFGLAVLLLSLIVDVLRELGVLALAPGIPIVGFTVMFLVAASALNSRFEREHRELESLRKDLEERVATRTRELEQANLRLAEASRTDALTGLPNRRGFFEVADHELKRSARSGESLSVLMIDLDHFKRINDVHGHAAGDAILQSAASTLRSVLRAQDVVARWGGEEFIALLPATDGEMALVAAEKARLALETSQFESGRLAGTITGSFGVAAHRPGDDFEAVIAAADRALYAAKAAGRNCVRSAEREAGDSSRATLS